MTTSSSTPDSSAKPDPEPEPIEAGLLHGHGEQWQIERLDGGKWLAIERPKVRPLARFYLAHSATVTRICSTTTARCTAGKAMTRRGRGLSLIAQRPGLGWPGAQISFSYSDSDFALARPVSWTTSSGSVPTTSPSTVTFQS